MAPTPNGDMSELVELRELLKASPLFSSLPEDALTDLVGAWEVVSAPGGTYLFHAGAPIDALYGVLYGALRLVRTQDGEDRTVRELYRGEMLGVLGMFTDRPAPVDVLLVRDSVLVRLERSRFLELVQKHPTLLRGFVRLLSEHALDLLEAITGVATPASQRGGNVTFLLRSPVGPAAAVARALLDVLLAERSTAQVTAEIVDRALGAGVADGDSPRLSEWLCNLERSNQTILYVADPRRPKWTARCVRQSDRLVVVAACGDERIEAITAAALAGSRGLARRIDVVSVSPRNVVLPSVGRSWTQVPQVRRIHHVREKVPADVERVARHLLGRPIAVVLSGGGARGLAHLGVLAALVEAKVPIDYICGTSIGAIFAAGLAQGWGIERMREMVKEVFTPLFALYDLTVPVSSLLAGKKLDRVLKKLFADTAIEDLWLPFFCVSTDLSLAALVVHDHGSLWKSVRASCTIPGLFPPLSDAGRALVDGGLLDNLPIDLMAERCDGTIIAVDVFPYGDPTFVHPAGMLAPRLRRLRTRMKGEQLSPPLFDILVRSTLVGSKFRQETAASRLERVIYLSPPVAPFGILQWRAHDELFETGYRYACEELSGSWQARLPLVG